MINDLIETTRDGEKAYAKCVICSFRKSAGSLAWASRYLKDHRRATGHDFGICMKNSSGTAGRYTGLVKTFKG